MRYKIVNNLFIFALLSLASICFGKQVELRGVVIGVENQRLSYGHDFEIILMINGDTIQKGVYTILNTASDSLAILVLLENENNVGCVQIVSENYENHIQNFYADLGASLQIDLGIITLRPLPLMIKNITYYSSQEQSVNMMDFEVRFRNNSGEEHLLQSLKITSNFESACMSPDPVFVTVSLNNEAQYSVYKGSISSVADKDNFRQVKLSGFINYYACGEQAMDLIIDNIDTKVPTDKYSKMIIRMPNEFTFYKVSEYESNDEDEEKGIRSIYEIFKVIPDIEFTFQIDNGNQPSLEHTINELH